MPGDWEHPAGIPPLTSGEVQLWRIELTEGNFDEAACLLVLNSDETERAGRLRAGQVRMQFLAGRSCLRTLLGEHLGIAPGAVPIVAAEYGKPELASPYIGRVHFNVAHSRSTVLIVLTLIGPIGIDIEYLDRKTEMEEVARHSLTERETSILLAIDDTAARTKFFFECWTRKEAVVKADGRGLSLPLTSFEVPLGGSLHPSPVTILNPDQVSHCTYFVSNLAVALGTASAMATTDRADTLRLLSFTCPVSLS